MTKTHFILSTAGHVDHGKTALIKALTDIDCDTHRAEKERGITINLGFAHINLSEEKSIGIVDVPGHKDFVSTMVAGASSTDIALLVVAADSGIMPQTEEHLQIMQLMGIKRGFVAITRTDLADPELIEIVQAEIDSLVAGTFLEKAPVVKTSAKTGEGIEKMKDVISTLIDKCEQNQSNGIFRLYIDRIFSVKGYGTVINGSAKEGILKNSDTIYLLPHTKKLRIRRMERFGREVKTVFPGDRTSINIVGLDKNEFNPGMLISTRKLHSSVKVDAIIKLFEHNRSFDLWSDMMFLLGTYQKQVKVHLLDHDRISAGDTAYVQIQFDKPCVAKFGDKFILRSTSNDITLGGGKILNIAPLHHRKRTEKVLENLKYIDKQGLAGLIFITLNKYRTALITSQISKLLNLSEQKVEMSLQGKNFNRILSKKINGTDYFMSQEVVNTLQERVTNLLQKYHRDNPISISGLSLEEFMGVLDSDIEENREETIKFVVDELIKKSVIKRIKDTYVLKNHTKELSGEVKNELNLIDEYIKKLGFETFDRVEFIKETDIEFSHDHLENLIKRLLEEGRIVSIQGQIMHKKTVEKGKSIIIDYLKKNSSGIAISTFRDLLGSSRRITLLICSYCDDNKITVRRGDKRFLTEKWKSR